MNNQKNSITIHYKPYLIYTFKSNIKLYHKTDDKFESINLNINKNRLIPSSFSTMMSLSDKWTAVKDKKRVVILDIKKGTKYVYANRYDFFSGNNIVNTLVKNNIDIIVLFGEVNIEHVIIDTKCILEIKNQPI